jgi:3-hexulose-6-phosphate synthase
MIGVKHRLQRAKELQQLGVHQLEVHFGLDEQAGHDWNFEELQLIRDAIKIPLAVAGGINETTIQNIQAAGVDIAVIGGAIYRAASPAHAAWCLRDKIGGLLEVTASFRSGIP